MTMKVINTIPEMRRWRQGNSSHTTALVPTMGFLHEGHLSLIREAKEKAELTVVSIYVNPTQFAPGEDLDKYPRDFERDEALCRAEGVDVVFYPSNNEMYPAGHKTYVVTDDLAGILCGQSRPTHFRGVTTIVAKLFNIIRPDTAVFGQKDAQQALIIRRMNTDLNFGINIVTAPIVRETDGLAMSSRNKYLSDQHRKEAAVLYQSLQMARREFESGKRDFVTIKNKMQDHILQNSSANIDYIEYRDAETLDSVNAETESILFLLAAYFGKTRLIDNIILT